MAHEISYQKQLWARRRDKCVWDIGSMVGACNYHSQGPAPLALMLSVGRPWHLHKGPQKPQQQRQCQLCPLTHTASPARPRMITYFMGQYKPIMRCLAVVIQKCESDIQACRVAREEYKDCRARVKNYKGWEFGLHINCSQYRGRCPQPTWPSGLSYRATGTL